MKRIKLMICEMFISYYEKRWKKAIDGMNEHIKGGVTPEFEKYSELNSKYGHKSLIWYHRKEKILKEFDLK